MPSDLRCLDDLDLYGAEVSGPLEALRQDAYHTLIEAYGSNLDAPGRGLNIPGQLSGTLDSVPDLQAAIEHALLADPRIAKCSASVLSVGTNSYTIDIQIVADEGALGLQITSGPNGLVLSSDGNVQPYQNG